MIIFDHTMEQYLTDKGIGSSTLKTILSSPLDYFFSRNRKNEDTKSMTLGTAIHMAILEPWKFDSCYALCIEDLGNRSKGDGKKRSDEFKATNEGKFCFFGEDAMVVRKVQVQARDHFYLTKLLSSGKSEVSAYVQDDYHLIRKKARADLFCTDYSMWDVKTTTGGIDDESISRTIFKYGYHFQAAHYSDVYETILGSRLKSFGWIFISTDTPAPHIVIKKASADLLLAGKVDHEFALRKHRECVLNNNWPGFPTEITEIGLPDYAKRIYE